MFWYQERDTMPELEAEREEPVRMAVSLSPPGLSPKDFNTDMI
jgi:hypothetical protein